MSECSIIGIDEEFGLSLLGDLDALCDVDLMRCQYTNAGDKNYAVKQAGYEAIKNDFTLPEEPATTHFNIGAIVHEMSGGNLQAIGFSDKSEVKQIVNDPQLLSEHVNSLTNQLLEVIKADLSADKLIAYVEATEGLKKEIASEKPSPTKMQHLFNSLAFMGDIEGTISLAARVWPYVYPLLVIAAEKLINAG